MHPDPSTIFNDDGRDAGGTSRFSSAASLPTFRLRQDGWYLTYKGVADFVVSGTLLVVTFPIVMLAVLLIKLTSSGPAFYSQVRLGKRGKPYSIWKLRTMYHDCEKLSGPQWSVKGDPRITPVGRFLRRTHIDE